MDLIHTNRGFQISLKSPHFSQMYLVFVILYSFVHCTKIYSWCGIVSLLRYKISKDWNFHESRSGKNSRLWWVFCGGGLEGVNMQLLVSQILNNCMERMLIFMKSSLGFLVCLRTKYLIQEMSVFHCSTCKREKTLILTFLF